MNHLSDEEINADLEMARRTYQANETAEPKRIGKLLDALMPGLERRVKAHWRGQSGRHDRYREYMESAEWRDRREAILERARRRCEECQRGGRLHVHHLTYERFGHEADEDLKALCHDCHARAHAGGSPGDD